ncbi:MAG: MltA domain-containing protein [Cyanobacteria bacterium P01_H01_bin.15]
MNSDRILASSLIWLALTVSAQAQSLPLRSQNSNQCLLAQGLDSSLTPQGKAQLSQAISYSLRYLGTNKAAKDYARYPVPGITRDRVRRSLHRFQQLLQQSPSPEALQASLAREFVCYQAIGNDGAGRVEFTGYFTPTYPASRVKTNEFTYPLYRKPRNFANWPSPHPTRVQLEGENGLLLDKSRLAGQELVWLRDRMSAFLVQVQGSAQLRLTTGQTMTIGFAGSTDYPYTSIGRQLVEAGIFTLEELTLPLLIEYFEQNPGELDQYISRNERYIFFQETNGAPPTGSIGVPVIADRSIATDKSLMPPGAIATIQARVPNQNLQITPVNRFVLDHDTGSAIKGPGRVDVFLGSGDLAGERAGLLNSEGALYYLLLK